MKASLKLVAVTALTLASASAFATYCPDGSPWPKNPNGSWKLNPDGSHYCPTTPPPEGQPITVTFHPSPDGASGGFYLPRNPEGETEW